jgi:transposase
LQHLIQKFNSFKKEFHGALRVLLIVLPNTKWCFCRVFEGSVNDPTIINETYPTLKEIFTKSDTIIMDKVFW